MGVTQLLAPLEDMKPALMHLHQYTSAYVSIRDVCADVGYEARPDAPAPAYVGIRQHTRRTYVSIRDVHTSAYATYALTYAEVCSGAPVQHHIGAHLAIKALLRRS